MDLINISIILTYLMIIAGAVIILTKKYWPYFIAAHFLMIVNISFYEIIPILTSLWKYLILFTLAFPLIESIAQKSKNSTKMIYSAGGLVVVLVIGYLLASSEVLPAYEKYGVDASTAKTVGMGINAFYFLAISAIGAVIYSEFGKAFKK